MYNADILMVEDDEMVGELLQYLLEREKMNVTWFKDGRTAHQHLSTTTTPYRVAMLDVMLPHVDGYSLVKQIREHPQLSGMPILMLTARAQEQDVVKALDLGADDYLVKPFQPAELTARVRRLLRRV